MNPLLLMPVINSVIDKVWPDPKTAAEAKLKVMELQQAGQLTELNRAADIIVAEANGSFLQRNWRPILMLTFAGLIVARMFGFTAPGITVDEYNHLWSILEVGIGGYVIGRSAEKIVPAVARVMKNSKEK